MEEFRLPLEHMAFKYWTITDLWIYFLNARVIVLLFIAAVIIWYVQGFNEIKKLSLDEDFKKHPKMAVTIFLLFWYVGGGALFIAIYQKYL